MEKSVTEQEAEANFRGPVTNQKAGQLPAIAAIHHQPLPPLPRDNTVLSTTVPACPPSIICPAQLVRLKTPGTMWRYGCKTITMCKGQISIAWITSIPLFLNNSKAYCFIADFYMHFPLFFSQKAENTRTVASCAYLPTYSMGVLSVKLYHVEFFGL